MELCGCKYSCTFPCLILTGSSNILHSKSQNDGTTFLRDILEKLCYREIRKTLKNTGILAALKILKIGV